MNAMKISGHTQPFAVLGHPIGHTLSPVMHQASFQSLGMDALYLAFDVHPDRLMQVLPAMQAMGFRGVNLTVPLKEVAFRGLSDLADTARRLGAVNTVEYRPDGGLRGHNTDGDGFLAAIGEAFATRVTGRSLFVLGCGGAGRAVALTCAAEGAARITLADIAPERARRLADEIEADPQNRAMVRACGGQAAEWEAGCREVDLVVHASPIGMKAGDPSLIGPEAFHAGQMAFDLIYMYPETPFMRTARTGGAKAANGLGMLLHQGARAFTIWTGRPADTGAMRAALEAAVYGP